jgi:hypothetical protein
MQAATNVIDLEAHRRARQPGVSGQDAQPWLNTACFVVPMIWVPVWFSASFDRGRP